MSLRGQELVGPVDILRKSQFLNPSENALQQHFWKDASSGVLRLGRLSKGSAASCFALAQTAL